MTKRLVLFIATNIGVLVTVSVVVALASATGFAPERSAHNLVGLGLLCLAWGIGGGVTSLALARRMAKWSTRAQLVDGRTGDPHRDWLFDTVQNLSRRAGVPAPEVGVYESAELNAFAAGPSRRRSLVAVSTGLLEGMRRDEIEGILGHELAHVANGDMVTMVLVQGVVNAFVLLPSVVAATLVRSVLPSRNSEGDSPQFLDVVVGDIVWFVAQITSGILGSAVAAWFSRGRELRADSASASLAGRGSIALALRRLRQTHDTVDGSPASLSTLKISGKRGFLGLLSTHPPLEERLRALETGR